MDSIGQKKRSPDTAATMTDKINIVRRNLSPTKTTSLEDDET
jgi:hypothetical protein